MCFTAVFFQAIANFVIGCIGAGRANFCSP